jgi:hypothetical protein
MPIRRKQRLKDETLGLEKIRVRLEALIELLDERGIVPKADVLGRTEKMETEAFLRELGWTEPKVTRPKP